MTDSQLHVAYIAVHDTDYPRNRRVRQYLERELRARVTVVPVRRRSGLFASARKLLRASSDLRRAGVDVVVLSEFALEHVHAARIVAWRLRAILVVDWFVGLYETRIEDAGGSKLGPKPLIYRLLDRAAVRAPDLVLTDTTVRASELTHRYRPKRPVISLPVGAPDWAVADSGKEPGEILDVLYYGNYVPLHAVDVILRAFASNELRGRARLTLVGDGDRRGSAEEFVRANGLTETCSFQGAVPESALLGLIQDHDIVLGIFGTSPKAGSVIANKVWQGLACNRPVITRTSDALREISLIVGPALTEVAPGDPDALAASIAGFARELRVADDERNTAHALEAYVAGRFEAFGSELRSLLSAPSR